MHVLRNRLLPAFLQGAAFLCPFPSPCFARPAGFGEPGCQAFLTASKPDFFDISEARLQPLASIFVPPRIELVPILYHSPRECPHFFRSPFVCPRVQNLRRHHSVWRSRFSRAGNGDVSVMPVFFWDENRCVFSGFAAAPHELFSAYRLVKPRRLPVSPSPTSKFPPRPRHSTTRFSRAWEWSRACRIFL